GARYQAKREIKSFWYPTWLAQPAAVVGEDAKLIDAPADELSVDQTMARSKGFELAILHTSTPSFANDIKAAQRLKDEKRDLKIENYFIGYLQHPYLSLYTGRGCPARCTFCLWPQTVGGHNYRTQSPAYVIEEMRRAKELFPQVKEFFFDDDTFTADLKR